MTTTRKSPRPLKNRAALALGLLLAGGGCAARQVTPIKAALAAEATTHTFTVTYRTNGCPDSADMDPALRNCDPPTADAPRPGDCVRVSRSKRHKVGFAAGSGAPAGAQFEIHFDPFKKTPAFTGNAGTLDIDVQAPYKTYAFYVVSGQCPVLDPIIIVEN